MRRVTIGLLALVLTACASGYSRFYTEVPGATKEAVARGRAAPPPATPRVERVANFNDLEPFARRGYVPIGYSSFNSAQHESEQGALAKGREVGADLVLIVNPSYAGTATAHVPITTPTSSTSSTTGSATAYGRGGSVTAYGTATTTTYGSTTTYVPVSVRRYDYGAVYLVKQKSILGVRLRDLSDEERTAIESNSGVYVQTVVDGTPAFRNDILVGDIIFKIDGEAVYGGREAVNTLEARRGEEIELTIIRNGRTLVKRIQLNP